MLWRLRAHRVLKRRRSLELEGPSLTTDGESDTYPQCAKCLRSRPDFDTWFHSYLAKKGVKLASRAPLDPDDASSIGSLIQLHGSEGMRAYLPTIHARVSSKPPIGKASSLRGVMMSGRPVEVNEMSRMGALYSDAKADLVLHCQCADRIARECGGHLYTEAWTHPSGEELSGGDVGEESESQILSQSESLSS